METNFYYQQPQYQPYNYNSYYSGYYKQDQPKNEIRVNTNQQYLQKPALKDQLRSSVSTSSKSRHTETIQKERKKIDEKKGSTKQKNENNLSLNITRFHPRDNSSSSESEYNPIYSPESSKQFVLAPKLRPTEQNQRSLLTSINEGCKCCDDCPTIPPGGSATHNCKCNRPDCNCNITCTCTCDCDPKIPNHPNPDICGCRSVPNACPPYESERLLEIYRSTNPINPADSPSRGAPVELIEELNDNIELRGTRAIKMNKEDEEEFAATGRDIRLHRVRDGPTETILKNNLINHEQNVKIRYLKPPTPKKVDPDRIFLREQPHNPIPAPPLVIRVPQEVTTLPDEHIRTLPPQSEQPETTTINVPGRDYLLKRKLVMEKFKPVDLPGDITVDRWLPYEKPPPIVEFQPAPAPCEDACHNITIQWHTEVRSNPKYEHIRPQINEDPNEYRRRHNNLRNENDLNLQLPTTPQDLLPVRNNELNFQTDTARDIFSRLDLNTLTRNGLQRFQNYLSPVQLQPRPSIIQ